MINSSIDNRVFKHFDVEYLIDEYTMIPIFTFINKKNKDKYIFKIPMTSIDEYSNINSKLLAIIRDEKLDELGL